MRTKGAAMGLVIWDELGIWKARLDDAFVEDLGID
jgi:hypothetical protein